MDIQVLRSELDTDPLTRGYAGMTDAEVATDLNTEYRTRNKDTITGSEAWSLTDSTEYNALTDAQKSQWLSLCAIDQHDPFGVSADTAIDIFTGGSDTIVALNAYRVESISRGIELGIGNVVEQHVIDARAL